MVEKNKICVFLPNRSELLIQTIESVANEMNIELVLSEGKFKESGPIAVKILHDNPDITAFIARFNSAAFIRQSVDIPVVDLDLDLFDFALALNNNCKTNKSPIMFIQFKGSPKIYDVNLLSQVSGVEIVPYYAEQMDFERDYSVVVKEAGLNRVITSVSSVSNSCENNGLDVIFVPFQKDNIKDTFQRAIDEGITYRKRLAYRTALSESFNKLSDGIIAIDDNDRVVECNDILLNIFKLNREAIIGHYPNYIKYRWPVLSHMINCNDNEIIEFQGKKYAINSLPSFSTDIIAKVRTITNISELQKKEQQIRKKIAEQNFTATSYFADIITSDSGMNELRRQSKRYASTNSTILITGESGTGKEVLAQSIHNASPFANGPFVAINCAALPETLLESELFGYEEGAFTGAKKQGKAGLIELSHNGTLFLDEISTMPMSLQSKLLRFIQEKQICRLGGTQLIPINNRIICASNRDLIESVRDGSFRDDLFYRLDVLPLFLPPLRNRGNDVYLLACRFLEEKYKEFGYNYPIPKAQIKCITEYNWPGNVRQLKAFIERIAVLSDNGFITETEVRYQLSNLPVLKSKEQLNINNVNYDEKGKSNLTDKEIKKKASEDAVKEAYLKHHGNIKVCCEELQISRTTLWKRLKEMGLDKSIFS